MAGGKIATAYVQVMPSMDGVAPAVKQHFTGAGTSAGHAFGRKFGTAMKVGIGAAAAATTMIIKESIAEGAALEQSIGGIETLFGAGGKSLQEYADSIGTSAGEAREEYAKLIKAQEDVFRNAEDAYRTAGLSANEYMETVTGFSASLISSLGGDTEKAAAVADMALVDMADNANKMGTDMELLQNAYQGFAKQNYTMLDNLKLGYGGTKGEMERLLADAQKLTGVEYDIGNLADVYSAIHAIQGELGLTGATALEASTTMTGSFNSMKAAFKNVLGDLALGRPMEKSLKALTETTVTFLTGNFLPTVGNIFKGLPVVFSVLWDSLKDIDFKELVSNLASGFTTFLEENLDDVMGAGGELLYAIIDGFLEVLPELAGAAGEAVALMANYLLEHSDEIIAAAWELGKKAAQAIWDSLVAFWNGIDKHGLSVVDVVIRYNVIFGQEGAIGGVGGVDKKHGGRGGSFAIQEVTGFYAVSGSHAKGLDYVPYDGYIAELHEGEMILTRAQASAVRRGRTTGGGIVVNQYFYDKYKSAADQQAAARYEQEKAVMGLV